MKSPSVILGVGVAIVRDGKILLSQRLAEDRPAAGLWAMPGGTVEQGEWPAEAARREVLEETGLRTIDIRPLPFWHWTDKWATSAGEVYDPWVTLYFTAKVAEGDPEHTEPHKHGPWMWHDPRNLPWPVWSGIEEACGSLGLL